MILGTSCNEYGSANEEGSEKLHFWLSLFFFVRVVRFCFVRVEFCEHAENDEIFLHEARQILRTILLLRPCSSENFKKVFSRSNFSNSIYSLKVLVIKYNKTRSRI